MPDRRADGRASAGSPVRSSGDRPNLVGRRSFPGRKVQERADGRPEFPLAEPTGSAPGGPAFRPGKVRRRAAEGRSPPTEGAADAQESQPAAAEGASPRDDPGGFRARTARQLPSCWRVAARAPAVSDSKIAEAALGGFDFLSGSARHRRSPPNSRRSEPGTCDEARSSSPHLGLTPTRGTAPKSRT